MNDCKHTNASVLSSFFVWNQAVWLCKPYIFRSDSCHGKHDPVYEEEEEDEEILGSDDDEQEDPKDYCKGELNISDFTIIL